MNTTSFITKDYENKRLRRCVKTNPIQTQYEPKTNPIPEKPKMNVTSILTKDYENETTFRLRQNKPNQTQRFFAPTYQCATAWFAKNFCCNIIIIL
jgi:hypothetical protein